MRVIISLLALGAVSRAATAENCEDKTITRKSIAKLTRSARFAIVQLDVLVERDNVVAASLSATARGNFGGSDNEAMACFCFMRARAAQDRRVDEIMEEADEINRKADAAVSSSRSSRSGDV